VTASPTRSGRLVVRPEFSEHSDAVMLPWAVTALRPVAPRLDDRTNAGKRGYGTTTTRRRILVTVPVEVPSSNEDAAPTWIQHVLSLDEQQTKELADALAGAITWWDESYPEEEEKADA
jgi:hypothetical protein